MNACIPQRIVARTLRWGLSLAAVIALVLGAAGVSQAQLMYTTDPSLGRITVHTINEATGQLRFNGYTLVHLGVPISNVVLAPSGKFVYAADTFANEIYGYSVSASGQLTSISSAFPQPVGAAGNLAMVTVASSGNTFLYAFSGGSLTVETVDPSTGAFTSLVTSTPTPGATQMLFDSAGKYAYFGTSTGVAAFTIDPSTGALTAISGSPFAAGSAGTDSVIIGAAPTRPLLYAANANDNHLYAFSITSTGALQAVGTAPATGNLPLGLAIDPLSQFVFVSNDVDSTVSPYLINADGSLTAESAVAVGTAPQELAVDPSGQFLYVQDQMGSLGYSGIQTYTIGTSASLTLAQAIGEPASGPMALLGGSGITYTPQFLFSANEGFSSVSAYQVDPASGNLTQVTGSPFPSGGSQTLAIVADPLGRFVYAANGSGNPNSVSAFTIGSAGSLTNVTGSPFGSSGFSTQGIAEDASGQFAYATSGADNEISEFTVDQTTGALAAISGSPFAVPNGGSGNPSAIANSPFGASLFVTNTNIDTVSALAISTSGALSNFNNSPINTGAGGPQRPVAVAVDPSNRFVYVVNATAQTIATYQFTDSNTVSPLPFAPISGTQFIFSTAPTGSLPTSIAIEPTGRFLYLTAALGPTAGAVEVFQIDQTTGALSAVGTPLSVTIPGGAGIGGGTLQGAAVDPSGKFLYAVANNFASSPSNSVIFEFTIDPTTGALTQQSTNFPVGYAPTSLAFTANIQSNAGPAFAQYSTIGPINFGPVNVGNSATQQLTLTNSGGGPFAVNANGISFSGSSSAFSLTNAVCNGVPDFPFSSAVTLGPGETCTFTLQFAPTLAQNGQAELLVVATTATNSNASAGPGGVGQALLLAGDGVTPFAQYSTIGPINFGPVNVGNSATQQLTLTNSGGGPFAVNANGISFSGSSSAFSLTNAVCNGVPDFPFSSAVTLGPGETCTFTLQFAPTSPGTGQAELLTVAATTTDSNASAGPGGAGQAFLLLGTGVAPNVTASANPATLSFGIQLDSVGAIPGVTVSPVKGAPQTVTLTNSSSGADLTGIIPSITGTNAGDFTATGCGTAASPGTLTAGANCTISVVFAPSVPGGGAESATLSIADNATGAPQTIGLSGTGAPFVMTSPLSSAITVLAGGSGTLTFNVTLGPGTGTLVLSCAALQGVLSGANCQVSDASTPPSSQLSIRQTSVTQTVAVTVTITTTSGMANHRLELPPAGLRLWMPASLMAMILLFIVWMSLGTTEKRRARAAWAFLALILFCGGWMAACGSGSGSISPNTSTTPTGSYVFDVTGKLGNATQTIALTLNVTK